MLNTSKIGKENAINVKWRTGEVTAARTKCVTNGGHGENNMKVVSTLLYKVLPDTLSRWSSSCCVSFITNLQHNGHF